MSEKYEAQLRKVRAARIQLIGAHPFWGDLAFGLPIKWDDTLDPPTAATNGRDITFHPEFVNQLPMDELIFVLAHEVMHPALMHVIRRGNRCPKRWNVACDIVVNELLVTSLVGKMPSFAIRDRHLYHQGGGKVETIYDLLPNDPNKYGAPGSGNASDNNNGKGPSKMASMDAMQDTPSDQAKDMAADWRNRLNQALHTAKAAGKSTGALEAFVEHLTVPKVSWREQLRNFVMTTRGEERTWSKRNRRYASTDIMLPGKYGERAGTWVVAPDCSGSTSDNMIAQVGAEVRSIQEELRPEKIHVICWDTQVKKHEEFEPDDPIVVKAYGRGGTDPRCLFEFIAKQGIEPDGVIVPTDLYFGGPAQFGPEPPYPVIWCVMESRLREAPWGKVLPVDLEN